LRRSMTVNFVPPRKYMRYACPSSVRWPCWTPVMSFRRDCARCRATDDGHVRLEVSESSVRRVPAYSDEVLPMSVWRCSLRTVNMNFCWSKMWFSSALPGTEDVSRGRVLAWPRKPQASVIPFPHSGFCSGSSPCGRGMSNCLHAEGFRQLWPRRSPAGYILTAIHCRSQMSGR
jgi:hypothetical protein